MPDPEAIDAREVPRLPDQEPRPLIDVKGKLRKRVSVIHPARAMKVTFNDLDRGRIEDALNHGYEVGRTAAV